MIIKPDAGQWARMREITILYEVTRVEEKYYVWVSQH
jgi:hypothetical protein